ncbi:hypothetical protein B0T13DRAFT_212808 [Neurospora crassa]|nr:hypothetical protein B0T13DRAFT_212808 [Neurospora crassa]
MEFAASPPSSPIRQISANKRVPLLVWIPVASFARRGNQKEAKEWASSSLWSGVLPVFAVECLRMCLAFTLLLSMTVDQRSPVFFFFFFFFSLVLLSFPFSLYLFVLSLVFHSSARLLRFAGKSG